MRRCGSAYCLFAVLPIRNGGHSPGELVTPTLQLERVETLESVRKEWSELAGRAATVFGTWEWASIWWRHFAAERPSLVAACRAEGNVVGVIPLYLWSSRPLRVGRFIGHGPADELGPLCPAAYREPVARALARLVADWRLDVFLGETVSCAHEWSTLLRAKRLRREASPILPLDHGSWESFLASRTPNLRQQIQRRERNLRRQHGVGYRLADDAARLPRDLDSLFGLHSARWRGTQTPFLRWEAFHRDFAAVALERGWLRLWFLEVDEQPVAAWYGFRFAGIESYYQSGRDPAWDRSSVGFVLLAHSIREALADGMREYRFLRGDESYKYRFAERDPGVETIALWRGMPGRLAVTAANLALNSRRFGPLLARLARPFTSR